MKNPFRPLRLVLLLLLQVSGLSPSALAQTTPMILPINSLFGGAAINKPITLTPVNKVVWDGANLWAGSYQVVPASTTNPIVSLFPGPWFMSVNGVVSAVRFTVPNPTNNQQPVTMVPTSGPQFFFGRTGFASLNAGTNIVMVTNSDSSITISSAGGTAAFGTATNLDGNATNQVNALALNMVQLFGTSMFPDGYVGPQYNDGVTMETPKWTNVVAGFPYTPGSEFNTVVPPPADIWLTYTNSDGLLFLIPGYRTFGAAPPPPP